MIKMTLKDFNLEKISRSGQCFRLNPREREEKTYALIAFGEYLEIKQQGEEITFSCTWETWESRWKAYFDCGTDYSRIYASVDQTDAYMEKAVHFGSGIRILRQELFETVICFIISQQNNIPRIKKCVEALSSGFGERRVNFRGEKYYVFPTPEQLAAMPLSEYKQCNLGYRDKYIKETAGMFAGGKIDEKRLPQMKYEEAKEELMKLYGVGVKVAECICLFSLHHTDAFPIDTHIRAVLDKYYPDGFPLSRYQGYAGILQQYAFFYDLYGEKEAFSSAQELAKR